MKSKLISPSTPLGKQIECLTMTKYYFEENNISSDKEKLLADCSSFKETPIQFMEQVHGNRINLVSEYKSSSVAGTDGLISDKSNLALAVLTADCLPVAISRNDGSLFGIVHAGWRGLLNGILEISIKKIAKADLGLSAWIGPSITSRNYEVGKEVYDSFKKKDEESELSFEKIKSDKWLFSLQTEAKRVMEKRNVEVEDSAICSYESSSLFSYRRNETNNRMITIIWRKI